MQTWSARRLYQLFLLMLFPYKGPLLGLAVCAICVKGFLHPLYIYKHHSSCNCIHIFSWKSPLLSMFYLTFCLSEDETRKDIFNSRTYNFGSSSYFLYQCYVFGNLKSLLLWNENYRAFFTTANRLTYSDCCQQIWFDMWIHWHFMNCGWDRNNKNY